MMVIEQLLKAVRMLGVYDDQQWDEYLRFFAGAEALHGWAPDAPQSAAGELGRRILCGVGARPAMPDFAASPKIRRWQDLARPAVRDGLTLGVVSGAYDLLHLGHLHGMREARQRLGEGNRAKLCVWTLSDHHIREKKGPGRPILDINERLAMLCAVQCVDYVVPLEEPNGLAAIEGLRPDFFFKSQEDLGQDIVKRELEQLSSFGGPAVLFANPVPGRISTTNLVEHVRQQHRRSDCNDSKDREQIAPMIAPLPRGCGTSQFPD